MGGQSTDLQETTKISQNVSSLSFGLKGDPK